MGNSAQKQTETGVEEQGTESHMCSARESGFQSIGDGEPLVIFLGV